jgi:CDP-diacylglycerol--glycerol-3-phosphate 3-phosphatidyltransferase
MRQLPNILTVGRLVLLPLLVILMMIPHAWAAWMALIIYIVSAITDWLDGYIARRMSLQSSFGTFLDPIADKIFILTVLITLVANGTLHGFWITPVILILAREFLIAGLREFLGPKNIQVPVSYLGKWKTAIQMIALGFLVIGEFGNQILPYTIEIGLIGLLVATALTIVTGWNYLKTGIQHL